MAPGEIYGNDAEAMELFRQEGVDKTRVESIKNLMKL